MISLTNEHKGKILSMLHKIKFIIKLFALCCFYFTFSPSFQFLNPHLLNYYLYLFNIIVNYFLYTVTLSNCSHFKISLGGMRGRKQYPFRY